MSRCIGALNSRDVLARLKSRRLLQSKAAKVKPKVLVVARDAAAAVAGASLSGKEQGGSAECRRCS
jgi:hypothetical protein